MFGNLWCASSFLSKFKYTSHKFCISDSRKALLKTATEHKLNYNLTKRKKKFIFLKNFCTSQMPWIPHKSTFKKTHMISKCLFIFFLINGLHKKLALLNLCVCVCVHVCLYVRTLARLSLELIHDTKHLTGTLKLLAWNTDGSSWLVQYLIHYWFYWLIELIV